MASRTKQKEEARARRLAEEQARLARERQQRRLRMIGGVVLVAVVVIAVAIAVSSGGGGSSGLQSGTKANKSAAQINGLVAGIPQSGNVIGSPSAKVTVTEFGDLQCPVCRDFAEGAEQKLIAADVRSGKVKLVYRSLSTATGNGPNPGIFPTQQAAALAAGLQGRAWNYVLLFYREQGPEDTDYVNDSYLSGLAKQISGLNLSKWQTDRTSPNLVAQVNQDQQVANAKGYDSTPTIIVSGPRGQAQPIVGSTDYGSLEKAVQSVS
jgi:protein-disulfide isomerase